MTNPPLDQLSFEQALADLEKIVRELEDGQVGLEESLTKYERGVGLVSGCLAMLRDAEQRILKLAGVDGEGKPILEPFDHQATADEGYAKAKTKTLRTKN